MPVELYEYAPNELAVRDDDGSMRARDKNLELRYAQARKQFAERAEIACELAHRGVGQSSVCASARRDCLARDGER
jgi:hypothetical protein